MFRKLYLCRKPYIVPVKAKKTKQKLPLIGFLVIIKPFSSRLNTAADLITDVYFLHSLSGAWSLQLRLTA